MRKRTTGYLVQVNLGGLSYAAVGGEKICGEIYDKSGDISVDPGKPKNFPGEICQLFFKTRREYEAAKKAARMVMRHYSAMLRTP